MRRSIALALAAMGSICTGCCILALRAPEMGVEGRWQVWMSWPDADVHPEAGGGQRVFRGTLDLRQSGRFVSGTYLNEDQATNGVSGWVSGSHVELDLYALQSQITEHFGVLMGTIEANHMAGTCKAAPLDLPDRVARGSWRALRMGARGE